MQGVAHPFNGGQPYTLEATIWHPQVGGLVSSTTISIDAADVLAPPPAHIGGEDTNVISYPGAPPCPTGFWFQGPQGVPLGPPSQATIDAFWADLAAPAAPPAGGGAPPARPLLRIDRHSLF